MEKWTARGNAEEKGQQLTRAPIDTVELSSRSTFSVLTSLLT
jgi:hypothetical protein